MDYRNEAMLSAVPFVRQEALCKIIRIKKNNLTKDNDLLFSNKRMQSVLI